MKWLFLGFVVCAACGKSTSKHIETVNDPRLSLADKTDAVCALIQVHENEPRLALSDHVKALLVKTQTDIASRNAQLDCVAKEVMATHDSGFYAYSENLPRAYVKNPSAAVKASLGLIDKPWLQKLLPPYIHDLVTRPEDMGDVASAAPLVSEMLDHAQVAKTWISAPLLVLWARTGDATLGTRIAGAEPKAVTDALAGTVEIVKRGPAGERKRVLEKLATLSKDPESTFFRERACELVSELAGCDAIASKRQETQATSTANQVPTSPLVAILQPVQQAGAKAAPQGKTPDWITEANGGADPSPVDEVIPEVPEMEAAIEKIVAAGPALHQDCKAYMGIGGIGGLTCARALGKQKLELLSAATLEHLATYNTMYASQGKKAHRYGSGVVIGLRVLEGFKDKAVDDVYLQSLSAVDPALAKLVIEKVKTRGKLEPVVDGLFQFMARKDKFGVVEIDNYVGLLTSYGGSVTAPVVKNLERELAKAKRPERVYWAHKLVSLSALEQVGTRDALPILGKYAADTGGYRSLKTSADTGAEVSGRDIAFADTVAKTRRAIATR